MTEPEFGIIVARHRRELHRHCARMLGSQLEAKDALQETFLRAWRSLRSCSSPRAWLYRIATNVCHDALARRRGAPTALDDARDPIAPREHQPDAHVISGETVELAVLTASARLPARQSACLVMRDVLRWSAEDTAAMLGVSVPASNSVLQRARASLRDHLAADRLDWTRP